MRTYIKAAFGNTASLFFVSLYVIMIALVAGVESNLYASIVQQVAPAVEARWVIVAVFAAVFALNVLPVAASVPGVAVGVGVGVGDAVAVGVGDAAGPPGIVMNAHP